MAPARWVATDMHGMRGNGHHSNRPRARCAFNVPWYAVRRTGSCEHCARPAPAKGACGGRRRLTCAFRRGFECGRVRVPGKGNSGHGRAAGDLYLRVVVKPHEFFERPATICTPRFRSR